MRVVPKTKSHSIVYIKDCDRIVAILKKYSDKEIFDAVMDHAEVKD